MSGAFIFVIYGLIIAAYPIFMVNLIIMFVNMYFLLEIFTKKDYFTVLDIESNTSPFLIKFIEYYQKDIKKVFPDFELSRMTDTNILIILRNMIPVGIFISRPTVSNQVEILIDYIIPDYRDFKNSIFLHSEEISKYKDEGYQTLITSTKNGMHRNYLLKMGYEQDSEDETIFKKKI